MIEANPLEQIDTQIYANRWIAVYMGRVIGIGLTAEQAHRAAKQVRPQRQPQLFFIGETGKRMIPQEWLQQQPLLRQIIQILQNLHVEAYLVGGAVRDLLMGRTHLADLDFATAQDGIWVGRQVYRQLEDAAFYPLDETRGIGRVICADKTYLDFSTLRGPNLLADLADRDFTINAIALDIANFDQLVDPFQGQIDLQAKRIQVVKETAFTRDPIRALRAVRQAIQFNFTLSTQTLELIGNSGSQLHLVSPERLRDELIKLLNTPAPGQAVQMLHELNLLPHILPEVMGMVGVEQSPPHYLDVFSHTCLTLDMWAKMQREWLKLTTAEITRPDLPNLAAVISTLGQWQVELTDYLQEELAGQITLQKLLPLALLLHDTGKPLTQSHDNGRIRFLGHEQESAKIARQIMARLRFSGEASDFVVKVTANHMRPLNLAQTGHVSRRTIYRLFRDSSTVLIQAGPAVAIHTLADHYGTYPPNEGQAEATKLIAVVNKLLTAYFAQRDQVISPPPLLTGRDLMQLFSLEGGPQIGQLLRLLQEAQASGDISDRDMALDFIKSTLQNDQDVRQD